MLMIFSGMVSLWSITTYHLSAVVEQTPGVQTLGAPGSSQSPRHIQASNASRPMQGLLPRQMHIHDLLVAEATPRSETGEETQLSILSP